MAVFDNFADQKDGSLVVLHNLFGVWINNLDASISNSHMLILPELFKDFSYGVFSLVLVYFIWAFTAGTVNTARDGTFLGREWDSYWIPIRMIVGVFFAVPFGSGFNTIQHMIFKIIFGSVLFANYLWTHVNYNIYSSGSIPAINYQNDQKLATDFASFVVRKVMLGSDGRNGSIKFDGLIKSNSPISGFEFNNEIDKVISDNSNIICNHVKESSDGEACKNVISTLGGDSKNLDYSIYTKASVIDGKSIDPTNNGLIYALKLSDLKAEVSDKTSSDKNYDLDPQYDFVNHMASEISGNINNPEVSNNNFLESCKLSEGSGINCVNLIGKDNSIVDYIVGQLTKKSSDSTNSSGTIYCQSILKNPGASGFVKGPRECKYFSWWNANLHYIEIDSKLAKNAEAVNELLTNLDKLISSNISNNMKLSITSAKAVFEKFDLSDDDLKPIEIDDTYGTNTINDQINQLLKSKEVSYPNMSSGVASDFTSDEFEKSYNSFLESKGAKDKDGKSGLEDTSGVFNLLRGLESQSYQGNNIKGYFSLFFNNNLAAGKNDSSKLFGNDDYKENYNAISKILNFLKEAKILVPFPKNSGDGANPEDIPANYIPRANPMYYVKDSGLLGSIFNGLLSNKSPLFNDPSHKNNFDHIEIHTINGIEGCEKGSIDCEDLTRGLLGQIYQIGIIADYNSNSGLDSRSYSRDGYRYRNRYGDEGEGEGTNKIRSDKGVYSDLLGRHFSMIQQVQTVGVNLITGVVNVMIGVMNDYNDKYDQIIDHANAKSSSIKSQYLKYGWSQIGNTIVKSKEINAQIGIVLLLAQIAQSLMWMPVVLFILTSLFTTGIMFSILIPMLPYILFWAGKVAWLLLVLEALVAGPVVVSVIIHPDGHKIWGYAEQAIKMLLNVFLMPPLLIIGLLCGIVLTYVVIQFSAIGFHYVSQEVLGMASFSSVSGDASSMQAANVAKGVIGGFMIMVYASFITMAFNKCFSTIYIIPEKVLSWVGIQGSKFGEQEGQEFRSSNQQSAKEGAQSGGQTLQQGVQSGEKISQTATDGDFKEGEAYGGISRGAKGDLGEVSQGYRGGRGG